MQQAPSHLKLLTLMSDHQLSIFLVANLMTGAVNQSIDTKAQGPITSICIVSLYMVALVWFAYSQPAIAASWASMTANRWPWSSSKISAKALNSSHLDHEE